MKVAREALALEAQGAPCTLVLVARTSGSTPRHSGASMLVGKQGRISGTIGGGAVELTVTNQASEMCEGTQSATVTHHLVRDLAMCCGGSMTFLMLPVSFFRSAIEKLIEVSEEEERTLSINLMTGESEFSQVSASSLPVEANETHVKLTVKPRPRLIIFGAGHVGSALSQLGNSTSFQVVVCDDDQTGALASWEHSGDRLVSSFNVSDVAGEIGGFKPSDYVVILTRDHATDQRILESMMQYLGTVAYLGVIGSRGKLARFKQRLVLRGKASEESWAQVRGPIGLDIGAETPNEIAVSVTAELISVRAKRRPQK